MPSLVDILKGLIVAAVTAGIVTWAHQKVLEERILHIADSHARRIARLEAQHVGQSEQLRQLLVFQAMQAERNRIADRKAREAWLRGEYSGP